MTQSSRVRNASRENLKLVDQTYGTGPLEVRSTDHYQAEYVRSFVEKWDALIDWDARAKSEGAFFIDLLRRLGKHKVLDVATGTGFHSVQLLEAGFQVTSADGNATMLSRAFENARARGLILRTLHADWRWLNRDVHDKYDAIICLGKTADSEGVGAVHVIPDARGADLLSVPIAASGSTVQLAPSAVASQGLRENRLAHPEG